MSEIDFYIFYKGVIGRKLPAKSTLMNMRKRNLVNLLEIAEHNHRVLAETYKIAVDTSKCNTCSLSLNGEESYQKGREDAIDECFKKIEQRLNDDTEISFDLPVEEVLGDDVDVNGFLMLAEEIVQKYKGLIFSKLKEAKQQLKEKKNE